MDRNSASANQAKKNAAMAMLKQDIRELVTADGLPW